MFGMLEILMDELDALDKAAVATAMLDGLLSARWRFHEGALRAKTLDEAGEFKRGERLMLMAAAAITTDTGATALRDAALEELDSIKGL